MEITGSALTALFIGLIWTLIKVVEFFIKKYGKTKEDSELIIVADKLAKVQVEQFKVISEKIDGLRRDCILTDEQKAILREIWENNNELYELHNVYNENHVPAWYVPSDLITLVRDSRNCLTNLEKSLVSFSDDSKSEQHTTLERLSDLISSQRIMTERVSDLISILNKFNRN